MQLSSSGSYSDSSGSMWKRSAPCHKCRPSGTAAQSDDIPKPGWRAFGQVIRLVQRS